MNIRSTLATLAVVAGGITITPRIAEACGGCFGPVDVQQVVTDHRMVMAIHADSAILWDQIRYTGAPQDFSWVLPVLGDARVEVASGEFFDTLDALTTVSVRGPVPPSCPSANQTRFAAGAAANAASDASAGGATVTVLRQETVGPYDTVLLRSTDPGALTTWLRSNNYAVPPAIVPVIDYYVAHSMDFIALRLRPGVGVQAMQPVRIRYAGANMVLPLRMVAAGVADKVGITLWVFGTGRHEAANFGNGTVSTSQLAWNWDTSRSNYAEVFRATQTSIANGRSWITEYAEEAAFLRYRFQFSAPASDGGTPGGALYDWQLATQDNRAGVWITKLRSDLLARYLDSDLSLAASVTNTSVSNLLSTTLETGVRPVPICASAVSVGGGAVVTCRVQAPGSRPSSAPFWAAFAAAAAATLLSTRRFRRDRRS